MSNVPDAVSAVRDRGTRLMASIWSAYYAALWRGDLAASGFAEWMACTGSPAWSARTEPPMRGARLPPMGAASNGFERDGWVFGMIPGHSGGYLCRALQLWSICGRRLSPPRRNPKNSFMRATGSCATMARDTRPGLARSSSHPRRRRHRLARQTTFHEAQRRRKYHDRTRLGHPDPDQPQYVSDPRLGDLDAGPVACSRTRTPRRVTSAAG